MNQFEKEIEALRGMQSQWGDQSAKAAKYAQQYQPYMPGAAAMAEPPEAAKYIIRYRSGNPGGWSTIVCVDDSDMNKHLAVLKKNPAVTKVSVLREILKYTVETTWNPVTVDE